MWHASVVMTTLLWHATLNRPVFRNIMRSLAQKIAKRKLKQAVIYFLARKCCFKN
jgi:hypothetical protein